MKTKLTKEDQPLPRRYQLRRREALERCSDSLTGACGCSACEARWLAQLERSEATARADGWGWDG